MTDTYSLLDSGNGKKLERFGDHVLVRPVAHAIWQPSLSQSEWDAADGIFTRDGKFRWIRKVSSDWNIEMLGVKFRLSLTDFGHLGIFPEQKDLWHWISSTIKKRQKEKNQTLKILNLFAYSGGSTLMAAKEGADVCHLDASKGMVAWARENAKLNGLEKKPIRWIVDDVKKFLAREVRRKSCYDGIILDPPSFGKGSQGQVFKFERDLFPLLEECKKLLSDTPLFLLLSCHTPNFSPLCLENILSQVMHGFSGKIDCGELMLKGKSPVRPLPLGTFARWVSKQPHG